RVRVAGQGVAQAPAGDHQGAGVDDRPDGVVVVLDGVDQLAFGLPLDREDLPAAVGDPFGHRGLDVAEGRGAVDLRLAPAENPEVRPVQKKKTRHRVPLRWSVRTWAESIRQWASPQARPAAAADFYPVVSPLADDGPNLLSGKGDICCRPGAGYWSTRSLVWGARITGHLRPLHAPAGSASADQRADMVPNPSRAWDASARAA